MDLKKFQATIEYEFKDINLLKQAFTHASFTNEIKRGRIESNERLEFLGDAVLDLVISEYIYKNYKNMDEGFLTKLRASVVCEKALDIVAKKLEIGKNLYLGKSEIAAGGQERCSIIGNAVEALVGAIYLDGGIESVSKFVMKHIFLYNEKELEIFDTKSHLQELIQEKHTEALEYVLLDETGPEHEKTFISEVRFKGEQLGVGVGSTKKKSEQKAAYDAIMDIREGKRCI